MKVLHQVLHDDPARHADYTGTETQRFPLSFCGRCWIVDEKVIIRATGIWEKYVNYATSISNCQKEKSYLVKTI